MSKKMSESGVISARSARSRPKLSQMRGSMASRTYGDADVAAILKMPQFYIKKMRLNADYEHSMTKAESVNFPTQLQSGSLKFAFIQERIEEKNVDLEFDEMNSLEYHIKTRHCNGCAYFNHLINELLEEEEDLRICTDSPLQPSEGALERAQEEDWI